MGNKILLFAFAAWLHYNSAFCCSCSSKYKITVQDYNSYDCIFVGKLINVVRLESADFKYSRKSTYEVIRGYKGASSGDTIHIFDPEDISACGLGRLIRGKDYIIFGSGIERIITSACSRTAFIPMQSWPRDSSAIKDLIRLSSFGRIYDTLYTSFHADTAFLNKHLPLISTEFIQEFYDTQGQLSARGKYKNGLPEGLWSYFKNGKLSDHGKYVSGRKDSVWIEPFEEKSVYIREYKGGEFTHKEWYYFEGRLSAETEPLGDGKTWIRYDYHPNGMPRFIEYARPPKRDSQGRLQQPVSNGSFKMFNRSGIVLQQGFHSEGRQAGHWKYYYEDGRLRMEGDYAGGEKSGFWKIYHRSGRLKASGIYRNDKKERGWMYYDAHGSKRRPDPAFIKDDEDWYTYSGVRN